MRFSPLLVHMQRLTQVSRIRLRILANTFFSQVLSLLAPSARRRIKDLDQRIWSGNFPKLLAVLSRTRARDLPIYRSFSFGLKNRLVA